MMCVQNHGYFPILYTLMNFCLIRLEATGSIIWRVAKKYAGSKQIGIFMVEYPEFALAMCENVYHDWIDGMSQGDMREQEKFKEYRLSRDKKLLEYIYQFKDEIQYVIFLNQARIEVIPALRIYHIL